MEIRSIKSPTVNALPPFVSGRDLVANGFVNGRVLRSFESGCKTVTTAGKLRSLSVRSQASGSGMRRSASVASTPGIVEKDDGVVFVAGATGRVGSRTVRELLKLGFSVRAGVRNKRKAESLVESVKRIKDASSTVPPVERLELVECDLEKPETIGTALGKAAVVICCIGASEKEVFDVSGPYRIDYLATKNLVDAAAAAKVKHFIMVSSLGTNKIGFPAAILNLFWGVLLWKRKAEESLIASGIPYTIVRPGGMERPTDAYKETHNITLSEEDTLFGGQVSNLQVAELMAFMAKNRKLSYCKVVEVIAETSAPLRPMDELLMKIPYQRVPPKELDGTIGINPEQPKQTGPVLASEIEEAADANTLDSLPESQSLTVEAGSVEARATANTPLSPFTSYEDLKPPTFTSPSPSRLPSAPAALNADSASIQFNTIPPEAPAVPIQEELVPSETLSPEAELAIVPSLPNSNATDVATVESTAASGPASISRPLSPFTAYEDLKPPSSPSPLPSGFKDKSESASPVAQTLTDMAVGASKPEQVSSPLTNGSNIAGQDTGKQEAPRASVQYLSPYHAYEDFKPPTSPYPSPRTSAVAIPSSSLNGGVSPTSPIIADEVKEQSADPPGPPAQVTEEAPLTKPKSSPLSPFTMYEDLKPPSSPVPSPRKV